MLTLLVNRTDFDQEWASGTLVDVFRPDMKVLIVPLSYNEGWASDAENFDYAFSEGSDFRYDLTRPFLSYQIQKENISFLDQYSDEGETAKRKIRDSGVIFLAGSDPDEAMDTLYDLGIIDEIKQFQGLVIGASAGAKILSDQYYLTPDEGISFEYHEGIGRIGADVDIHYMEDEWHLSGIIRSLELSGRNVIVLPEKSGMLVGDGNIEVLGDAMIANENDLDKLYLLYQRQFD